MELDEETKVLKSINLDDSSIGDFKEYIESLNFEIKRSKYEMKKY